MYRGHFNHYVSPKSLYPNKTIDACPPPSAIKANQSKTIEKLYPEDTQQLRDFAISYGESPSTISKWIKSFWTE